MKSPASIIVHTYPDKNPFDVNSSYPNIFPKKPIKFSHLNSTEISDTLKVQDRTWCNPLAKLYGHNSFQFTNKNLIPDEDLFIENQTSPPPLPKISLLSLKFIKRLNPKGRTPIYKVSTTINLAKEVCKTYTLKMDKDLDEETKIKEIGWPMFHFRREKKAYAYFICASLSDQGIISCCYSWLTITQCEYLKQCYNLPISQEEDSDEYAIHLHDQY
ncbi:hypothetical protein C8Q75DRAFT_812244 [Abortiporus biennis]|nr:hypothetical protein C8Q75DRAFT_812244 [Abortiporus biennis]